MPETEINVKIMKCGVPCDNRSILEIAKSVIMVLSQNEQQTVTKDKE